VSDAIVIRLCSVARSVPNLIAHAERHHEVNLPIITDSMVMPDVAVTTGRTFE
jgi:hypothetical protein